MRHKSQTPILAQLAKTLYDRDRRLLASWLVCISHNVDGKEIPLALCSHLGDFPDWHSEALSQISRWRELTDTAFCALAPAGRDPYYAEADEILKSVLAAVDRAMSKPEPTADET